MGRSVSNRPQIVRICRKSLISLHQLKAVNRLAVGSSPTPTWEIPLGALRLAGRRLAAWRSMSLVARLAGALWLIGLASTTPGGRTNRLHASELRSSVTRCGCSERVGLATSHAVGRAVVSANMLSLFR